MKQYPSIGSISTGTLRPADLLDTFADELESLVQRNAEAWCSDDGRATRDRLCALVGEARECDAENDPDTADDLVAELIDALQEFAPDYVYFGTHPGNGADYGFWVIDDVRQQAEDDGALIVSDTSEIPDDYRGLCLHVNDHGNATLYAIDAADVRRELWSCV